MSISFLHLSRRPFRLTVVSASGSITINDTQYKWKAKGTGSKLVVRLTPPFLRDCAHASFSL